MDPSGITITDIKIREGLASAWQSGKAMANEFSLFLNGHPTFSRILEITAALLLTNFVLCFSGWIFLGIGVAVCCIVALKIYQSSRLSVE
ncbi:MAG: hypothetical protein LBS68_01060 [Puniceicoccales bacterium]|jgi:hypothetical protein|nr:hypothetical protein [Puniceicoccales bacterium]